MTGGMSEGEYQSAYADPDPGLMGEEAYLAACAEIAPRVEVPPALRTPKGEWRTRDGRTLRVEMMTADHLRNVIRLFERAGWAEHHKLDELREELTRR